MLEKHQQRLTKSPEITDSLTGKYLGSPFLAGAGSVKLWMNLSTKFE